MHAKENDPSEWISTLCTLVNLMFSLGCRNALGGKSFLLSPRPLADHLKVCKRKIENFFTLKKTVVSELMFHPTSIKCPPEKTNHQTITEFAVSIVVDSLKLKIFLA